MEILREYLFMLGWGITGAVTLAVSLPILLWIFDRFSPIDEWAEIKRGNWSVAIVISTLILSLALVIINAIS